MTRLTQMSSKSSSNRITKVNTTFTFVKRNEVYIKAQFTRFLNHWRCFNNFRVIVTQ